MKTVGFHKGGLRPLEIPHLPPPLAWQKGRSASRQKDILNRSNRKKINDRMKGGENE